MKKILTLLVICTCCCAYAQTDTVFTLQHAKNKLLNLNLNLLASYYQVDIAKARLIQAKVWNNPYFVFNGDLYSNETNEYFHFRNQHLLQLEQTFSIAGKHTNTVKLAKIDVRIAEQQLEEVLRSLLFELCTAYNELSSLQQKEQLYQQVLTNYDKLMAATKRQYEVGSISLTEALRLESEYVAIKTESAQISNQKEASLADMRTLLRLPIDTIFYVEQKLPITAPEFDVTILIEQAKEKRPDVLIEKFEQEYSNRNLKLQKSLGVPDLKLAYQPRDRGSNYVRPYQGFNVEFSVPLFDRNQGEIKAARFEIKKSNLELMQVENRVENEIYSVYARYKKVYEGLKNYSDGFISNIKQLNVNTNNAFQKRNISLLEFIDQQRIYVQTNIQLIDLKKQFLNNVSELNFVAGTNLIDY
jgi:cobalt-zinc-cadmium efflux system outer membrane protein